MGEVIAGRERHRRGGPAVRARSALLGDRRQRARTSWPPNEVRIKLSELCYKSIACDVTEDKKHIDLSSEPLILVCAAGLVGGTADDVAKEVAIYKAHKATPIVIATEGDERFAAAVGGALRPGRAPCAGLRPLGDGRPPVRLRGRAGHRRLGSTVARGARGDRAMHSAHVRSGDDVLRQSVPASGPHASGSTTGCAPACTTATSRRRPRCA